jgi:hypothetical protein
MIFGPKPESQILPRERRVVRFRPHWMSQWKVAGQTIIAIFLLVGLNYLLSGLGSAVWVLTTIVWWLEILALLYFAYHLAFWWEDRVMVTDKRFLRVRGVFTTTVDMMPITKVTDMTHKQSFLGWLLGYGTIRIESAGQMQSLEFIQWIPDYYTVYVAINGLVFGDDGSPSDNQPPPRSGPFAMFRKRKSSRGIDNPDMPSTDDLTEKWSEK